jgi:hypothetical protein
LRLALADFDTACACPNNGRINGTTARILGCPDAAQARERVKAALDRRDAN